MNPQVVIVGGGPTGLLLGCELRLAGVRVTVLERLPEPGNESRSLVLGNRSVESLNQRGLDRFSGAPRAREFKFGMIDLTAAVPAEALPVRAPQWQVEEMLRERALRLGVDLRPGHEAVGLEQDEESATVDVRHDGGSYRLTALYVAGCDGAHSTVRKLSGIGFPGTEATVSAVTGEMILPDDPFDGRVFIELFASGMVSVIPLGDGLHRVASVEFGTQPPPRGVPVTAEEIRESVRRVSGLDLRFGEIKWTSRFGDATRLAETYRRGRVVLAGDAAHIHFPAGGPGMNTGLQDVANLGWKLAAAVAGWAPPGLMDTYHTERHLVGERVCDYSRAQISLMHPLNRIGPLRDLFAGIIGAGRAEAGRYLVEAMTGLDIAYPVEGDHPLTGRRVPHVPLVADGGATSVPRLLHEGRGVLLDLSEGTADLREADAWRDRIDVVAARPAPELDAVAVLIRPDGYAAWAAGPDTADVAEGLRQALTTWFGESVRPPARAGRPK